VVVFTEIRLQSSAYWKVKVKHNLAWKLRIEMKLGPLKRTKEVRRAVKNEDKK
jgi:hypothetical protein